MELFYVRKIHRICPQQRGLGPPTLSHGSMDFMKRWSLASGLMAQIESSELVSRLFINDLTADAAGSGRVRCPLPLAAAHRGRAWWLTGVGVFLSYGGRFLMRFAPMGSQR
jgi:hypothetical protein